MSIFMTNINNTNNIPYILNIYDILNVIYFDISYK